MAIEQAVEPEVVEEVLSEEIVEVEEPVEEPVEEEPLSLREQLEAAFDADKEEESSEFDSAPAQEEEEVEALPPIDPPVSWRKEEKEFFSNLPREAQETLVRRESEREKAFAEKANEAASVRQALEPINQALAPLEPYLQQAGITRDEYLKGLVQADLLYRQDPKSYAQRVLESAGLDAAKLAEQESEVDPALRQIQQELMALKTERQREQQLRLQQEQMGLQEQILNWAQESNEGGQPLRPHFDAVADKMLYFVGQVRQTKPHLSANEVLDEAYNYAVVASPEIQDQLRKEAELRTLPEKAAKVAEAKKKGGSIKGTPVGTPKRKPPTTLRGMLEAAWDDNA